MRCPFCDSLEDRVLDSRQAREATEIRRRRQCSGCGRRFTTYERIEDALPAVIKADGRREAFDRNKLVKGLKRATAKRPVGVSELQTLAEIVEREICDLGRPEINSRDIGERVLPLLRQLDDVSYVRFASIYRDFRDIDEFVHELASLKKDAS